MMIAGTCPKKIPARKMQNKGFGKSGRAFEIGTREAMASLMEDTEGVVGRTFDSALGASSDSFDTGRLIDGSKAMNSNRSTGAVKRLPKDGIAKSEVGKVIEKVSTYREQYPCIGSRQRSI